MTRRLSEEEVEQVYGYSVEPWVWISPSLPDAIDPEEVWNDVAKDAHKHGMSHLMALEKHALRMLKSIEGGFAGKLTYYEPDIDDELKRLPTEEGKAILELKLNVAQVMMDDLTYRGRIKDWDDVDRSVGPREPKSRFEAYLQTAVELLFERGYDFGDRRQSLWEKNSRRDSESEW